MWHLLAVMLTCFAAVASARGAEVDIFSAPAPIDRIVENPLGVFALTAAGNFEIVDCDGRPVCMRRVEMPIGIEPASEDGLPDGRVAKSDTGDIRRAWYARPTSRYGHGVLGDRIEAGSLVVETADGRRYEFVLDRSQVFEDITPRIFDLDRDGRNEIVTIRSSLDAGAAVAVYWVVDGVLTERAATAEIGRPHRWLNIAGIADYSGTGKITVVWVETPHIGGVLRMGSLNGGEVSILPDSYVGVSNHFIGSRELNLSVTADLDGDGVPDLALPSQDRRALLIVAGGNTRSIPLPARIDHALAMVGIHIVTADAEGRLMVIRP